MKLIVAAIRAEKLSAMQRALDGMEVHLMHTGVVADVWHQRRCIYRGVEYQVPQARLRVEILVLNEMRLSCVVEAINRAAFASSSGLYESGDIFVVHLDEWVSIRARTAAFRPALTPSHQSSEMKATECASHK